MNKKEKISNELEEAIEFTLFDINEQTADELLEEQGVNPDDVITSVRSILTTHVQHFNEENGSNRVVSIDGDRKKATNLLAVSNLVAMLRRQRKLSREELAKKSGVTFADVEGIETASGVTATPRIVATLEIFFELPQHSLSEVAGFIKRDDREFNKRVTAFAAQSPGFDKLSPEEREVINEFVTFLAERSDQISE